MFTPFLKITSPFGMRCANAKSAGQHCGVAL
jgi:hypothetical protein